MGEIMRFLWFFWRDEGNKLIKEFSALDIN